MENKLENLKEKMDNTILRDVSFDDKHYRQVLSSIKSTRFRNEESPWKNRFNSILSVSVVSLLFIGITYFTGKQLNFFDPGEKSSEPMQESLTEPLNKKTAYLPPKQEENYNEMTKEEILTKMLNTVDHFETARGEFELYYANIDTKMNVHYELSIREKSGGLVKTITNVNGETSTRPFSYKDVYTETPPLKIEDAFRINEEGDQVTDMRWHPPIQEAASSLFPYEIASNYTRNLSLWEIEKQNEELLGHNTLVIKGVLNDYASSKSKSNTFRFWVDKDTGILIKYETYNAEGTIVDYLHPTKMEVNVPVNYESFTPQENGMVHDKKMKVVQDPRDNEVVQVAGTKNSSEIDHVFNLMKNDLPFLYEVNHADLKLTSASYETFKDYKIGYLYYILDPDKDGNSSQMLSIRVHHKDSYVRKIGNFEIEGDTKVAPFELNGIRWEGTSLQETDGEWVHLTGQKGDYIYDVVSQHISLDETREYLKEFKPVN
jgi:hypothetical protein